MKHKILVTIAVTGLTASVFGQDVVLDNLGNSGSISATSGGLVYIQAGGGPLALFDGADYDLGITVFGGPSINALSLIGTYTPANDPKGFTGGEAGTFQLGPPGSPVTVPGVAPGGTAWIELVIWDYNDPNASGTFQSYAPALEAEDPTAIVWFQNPTSNSTGSPPVPAPELTGMPSVLLTNYIPEPATLALASLGLVSLMALGRKYFKGP